MRQGGRIMEACVRAIHDVLMMAVVARSQTVTAIFKSRAALNPGRFRCLQRVKIRIVAIVDRSGDRHGYE